MRALVLSGGGAHGAFQVGVLKHLLGEQKKQYDILAGVSVGALNAGFLAQFKNGQEKEAVKVLEKLWLSLDNSSIKSFHFPPYMSALWNTGMFSTKPLRNLVEKHLNVKAVAMSGKILRIGAVSLTTAKYGLWTEKDSDLVDGIMASSAFPGFFDTVKARGEEWSDGGIREVTPLKDAIDAGATEIDVILASTKGVTGPKNKFNSAKVIVRSLSIMMDEVFENDLKVCALKNGIEGYRKIDLKVYRPQKAMGNHSLDFDPEHIEQQIQAGYDEAIKNK